VVGLHGLIERVVSAGMPGALEMLFVYFVPGPAWGLRNGAVTRAYPFSSLRKALHFVTHIQTS
jgi:hypothetical protein